jgi:hypothetical protein
MLALGSHAAANLPAIVASRLPSGQQGPRTHDVAFPCRTTRSTTTPTSQPACRAARARLSVSASQTSLPSGAKGLVHLRLMS